MELAGRTALLTGATGGLGRAIADGAGRARGEPRRSAPARPRRWRRSRRSCRARATGSCPPTWPSRARPSGSPPRRGAVDVLVANAGLPAAAWLTDFTAEQVSRALRVNLEAPMLIARALFPAMLERAPVTWSSSPRSRASRPARAPRSTTRPSSACAASPSACAADLAPGGRRLARLAGLRPRSGDVRRLRRQAAPRAGHGARPSRSAPRSSRRSSTTRSRSPSRRCRARPGPLRAGQPAISVRAQSGSAGQKVGARRSPHGHPKDKR